MVINNQLGFTATPSTGRSSTYSTCLAKTINAPIFHVNSESLEDVHRAFYIAGEYRQKFGHDVVIDLISYRKFGHNELDNPSFTSPIMYEAVKDKEPVARMYERELLEDGTIG